MALRDFVPNDYSEVQLRKMCLITGYAEMLLALGCAVFCLAVQQDTPALVQSVSAWMAIMELVVVPFMLFGAFLEKMSLLWPYIIVKMGIVFLSAVLVGLCVMLKVIIEGTKEADKNYEEHAFRNNMLVELGFICLTFNIVPLLIVRKYQSALVVKHRANISSE